MESDPDAIPEFTDTSEETATKRPRFKIKPLFKFRIVDLLSIPYDKSNDSFKYKSYDVNLVMCGGKITDIFRDDIIFAFEMNDGTGSIRCFHKFKHDPNVLLEKLEQNSTAVHFLQNTFVPDESCFNEDTIFNIETNDLIAKQFEENTTSTLNEILFWFKNQTLETKKNREIGNTIHITGHLLEDESVRKINILDFRIVENDLEHEDLQLEIKYLHKYIYV